MPGATPKNVRTIIDAQIMKVLQNKARAPSIAGTGTNDSLEGQRFRSFCERFVIARAATFSTDKEESDTWECILRAKSAYRKIAAVAREFNDDESFG